MARTAVGPLVREWRIRRRRSQLDLALDAGVSPRHLSFIETGRSRPSPELLLLLADRLEVPLRERNRLLLAAGYAPRYSEMSLDEADMAPVRDAMSQMLDGVDPWPAIVIDRKGDVVMTNAGAAVFLDGVEQDVLAPMPNLFRLTLHPRGVSGRIVNFPEVAAFTVAQLRRLAAATGDPAVVELLAEVTAYPNVAALDAEPGAFDAGDQLVVPLRVRHHSGELAMFSTMTVFGTPVDVTVAELAIETFFPADEHTAEVLRARARATTT
jgi:transcriptional regulator with XRE-family HTH domain